MIIFITFSFGFIAILAIISLVKDRIEMNKQEDEMKETDELLHTFYEEKHGYKNPME